MKFLALLIFVFTVVAGSRQAHALEISNVTHDATQATISAAPLVEFLEADLADSEIPVDSEGTQNGEHHSFELEDMAAFTCEYQSTDGRKNSYSRRDEDPSHLTLDPALKPPAHAAA